MYIRYENASDILILQRRSAAPVDAVKEDDRGNRSYFDAAGQVVRVELVNASRQRDLVRHVEGIVDRVAAQCLPKIVSRRELTEPGRIPA